VRTRASPIPRSKRISKRNASSMRSVCRRTAARKRGSVICRPGPSDGRQTNCPISPISPEAGTKPRRAVAKAEWHPGELYPNVRFVVTNLYQLRMSATGRFSLTNSGAQIVCPAPRSLQRGGLHPRSQLQIGSPTDESKKATTILCSYLQTEDRTTRRP
jgi:hypothetical protein